LKAYILEGSTWDICVAKTNDSLKNERSKLKKASEAAEAALLATIIAPAPPVAVAANTGP
jgi:hypothetical protein